MASKKLKKNKPCTSIGKVPVFCIFPKLLLNLAAKAELHACGYALKAETMSKSNSQKSKSYKELSAE